MIDERTRLANLLKRAALRKKVDKEKTQRLHKSEKVASDIKENA